MKHAPKKQSNEYVTFSAVLKKVLTVSRAELERRMEADKTEKQKRQTIRASSARVSRAKD
ncbi:MAG TPA: hypothetical protein VHF01_11115 [Candidatus Acidoferrum sp.]|nr:hypothetical protein [Candidatus Acidoferrum sp.]